MSFREIAATAVLSVITLLSGRCRETPDTALTRAAAAGDESAVAALIVEGADVDAADGNGWTPVVWASRRGHVGVLRLLLQAGADPTLPGGSHEWTPLLHAVHEGQNEAASALLGAGVDVEGRDGSAALMVAAGFANEAMVRELLARGAEPRASFDGVSVLAAAVGGAWDRDYSWPGCGAHTATVRALLEAHPDLEVGEGLFDRLARAHARRRGCRELLEMIGGREGGAS